MTFSPHQKRFSFAESNQKIRMELRQADLKLQKELERLEKQSYTATNNISNHQQVLKNSWRRLEQKRLQDQMSPLTSRKTKKNLSPAEDTRKRLMFANKTSLSSEIVTPKDEENGRSPLQSQRPFTNASHRNYAEDLSSTGSLPHLQERMTNSSGQMREPGGLPQTRPQLPPLNGNGARTNHTYMQRSPYISSPYAFRRTQNNPPSSSRSMGRTAHPLFSSVTQANNKSQNEPAKQEYSPTVGSMSATELNSSSKDGGMITNQEAQLPLNASMNTKSKVLNLSSKTVSKCTLLKAKEFLEIDSDSHGPMSFKKFYENSNNSSVGSKPAITLDELEEMTEEDFMEALTEEEQEQLKTAKEEVRTFSIKNMCMQNKYLLALITLVTECMQLLLCSLW